MRLSTPSRSRMLTIAAVVACLPLTAACGNSGDSSGSPSEAKAGASAPLFAGLPARIQDAGDIVNGAAISFPPFESFDTDGKTVIGFEPEITAAMQKQLGVSITWKDTPFDGLFSGLPNKRYDMIMSGVTDTVKREESYDFVNYARGWSSVLVLAGNPSGITSEDATCGKTLSVTRGTKEEDWANKQSDTCKSQGKAPIKVVALPGDVEGLAQLKQKAVDGVVSLGPAASQIAHESGGEFIVAPDVRLLEGLYGILVRKDDTQLRDSLQKALQAVVDSGEMATILGKYDLGDRVLEKVSINGAGQAG